MAPPKKTAADVVSDYTRDLTRLQVQLQVLQERHVETVAADPRAAGELADRLRTAARALTHAADSLDGQRRTAHEAAAPAPRPSASDLLMDKTPKVITVVRVEATDPA